MEKKSFKRNPIYIQYEVRYSEYLLMKRIFVLYVVFTIYANADCFYINLLIKMLHSIRREEV